MSVSLMDVLRERETQARAARACHLAAVLNTDSMGYWLAMACKQAREAGGRKQVHVAASHVHGVNQSTIARFEDASAWPMNPDMIVAAYAHDLDVRPDELWQEGLNLWARYRAGETLSELGVAAKERRQRRGNPAAPERNGRSRRRAG